MKMMPIYNNQYSVTNNQKCYHKTPVNSIKESINQDSFVRTTKEPQQKCLSFSSRSDFKEIFDLCDFFIENIRPVKNTEKLKGITKTFLGNLNELIKAKADIPFLNEAIGRFQFYTARINMQVCDLSKEEIMMEKTSWWREDDNDYLNHLKFVARNNTEEITREINVWLKLSDQYEECQQLNPHITVEEFFNSLQKTSTSTNDTLQLVDQNSDLEKIIREQVQEFSASNDPSYNHILKLCDDFVVTVVALDNPERIKEMTKVFFAELGELSKAYADKQFIGEVVCKFWNWTEQIDYNLFFKKRETLPNIKSDDDYVKFLKVTINKNVQGIKDYTTGGAWLWKWHEENSQQRPWIKELFGEFKPRYVLIKEVLGID